MAEDPRRRASTRCGWAVGWSIYRMHPGQSSHQILAMKRTAARVYHGLREEDMPSRGRPRGPARGARGVPIARWRSSPGRPAPHRWGAGLRNVLGAIRKRAGLTWSWYDEPPAEITDAFGDLRTVDQA